jgi:enolase
MTAIESVAIRKILDSRGNPTVEVDVWTADAFGTAAAPSGASTGVHEVCAFPAQGVDFAIKQFREQFAPKLEGLDVLFQRMFDSELKALDGTSNFSKMGGNLAVAASLAVAKAAADSAGVPLYQHLGGAFAGYSIPMPLGNVLGGGAHSVGGTDIQEYLAVSFGPTVADSIFGNALAHKKLKAALVKKFPGMAIGKSDEGAWTASLGNEDALAMVADCCKEAGKQMGFSIKPSLDMAASELYKDGVYRYKDKKMSLSSAKQVDFVERLVKDYQLYSVEDPLDQEDFQGYAELTERIGARCLVIGDDLFVTNTRRIKKGVDMGACNAVLIKPNQVGTLSDTYDSISLAHQHGYKTVISHRSGETEDATIAHLGVAFGCHGIKTGTVSGERTAKLNELIRIEETVRKDISMSSGV